MFVVEATEQLSAVTGVPSDATVATQVPAFTFTVMFAGQVIVGLMLSITVTVNEQVDTLFDASVTVYVTVVTPRLNVRVPTLLIPVAGDEAVVAPVNVQVNLLTEQLSAVVGLGVTTDAVQVPVATFAVMFAGHVTVGLMLSTTVTVMLQLDVFP